MTKMLEHEVEALRRVPLFSGVEPMKLKLLAFASERIEFAAGQDLMRQGDHFCMRQVHFLCSILVWEILVICPS